MSRAIILVFGPSGVGKTTIIRQFIQSHPNFIHFSSGTLIDSNISDAQRDLLRLSSREQILSNQLHLTQNFQKLVQENKNKNIIFDGHCTIDNGHEFIDIPFEVIDRLHPSKIVFMNADYSEIIAQRKRDTSRPLRSIDSIEHIERFVQQSINTAKKYAKKMDIPFVVIQPSLIEFQNVLLK
jgi:adenylate kinase